MKKAFYTLQLILLATVLAGALAHAGRDSATPKASAKKDKADSALILRIEQPKLTVQVRDFALLLKLKEHYGHKPIVLSLGEDSELTLKSYKGLGVSETQAQLVADIPVWINEIAASSTSGDFSALPTKTQEQLTMLSLLREQIALNWAETFVIKAKKKVKLADVQELLKVELLISIDRDTIKTYFNAKSSTLRIEEFSESAPSRTTRKS